MTSIPFGAVVLTDFPFTDLTAAKRRPALVVSTDNDRRTDIVVAFYLRSPRRTTGYGANRADSGEWIESSVHGPIR